MVLHAALKRALRAGASRAREKKVRSPVDGGVLPPIDNAIVSVGAALRMVFPIHDTWRYSNTASLPSTSYLVLQTNLSATDTRDLRLALTRVSRRQSLALSRDMGRGATQAPNLSGRRIDDLRREVNPMVDQEEGQLPAMERGEYRKRSMIRGLKIVLALIEYLGSGEESLVDNGSGRRQDSQSIDSGLSIDSKVPPYGGHWFSGDFKESLESSRDLYCDLSRVDKDETVSSLHPESKKGVYSRGWRGEEIEFTMELKLIFNTDDRTRTRRLPCHGPFFPSFLVRSSVA